MFYSTTDGQYINEGTQFVLDGITYPPQWLNQSTPEQKAALGLEEVIATNQPYNPVYYWTNEVLDKATLTYEGRPKDLTQVKTNSINNIKQIAFTILQPTDYIEIRNIRDQNYKIDWMLWRDSVRINASVTNGLIQTAKTVDEIANIMDNITWPSDPSTPTLSES